MRSTLWCNLEWSDIIVTIYQQGNYALNPLAKGYLVQFLFSWTRLSLFCVWFYPCMNRSLRKMMSVPLKISIWMNAFLSPFPLKLETKSWSLHTSSWFYHFIKTNFGPVFVWSKCYIIISVIIFMTVIFCAVLDTHRHPHLRAFTEKQGLSVCNHPTEDIAVCSESPNRGRNMTWRYPT